MKSKAKISYFFAAFFTLAFIISFKYFDAEAASMLLLFGVIAFISGIINFKLNR